MNRHRELARALADLWNEEIPRGTRVLIQHGGERIEAETLGAAWASFDVPVIQVCCYRHADLRIVLLRELEPVGD